jgi:hypothetical protein
MVGWKRCRGEGHEDDTVDMGVPVDRGLEEGEVRVVVGEIEMVGRDGSAGQLGLGQREAG